MVASVIFILGLVFLLFALWELSGIWFEQKDSRKLRSRVLVSRLATIRPKAAMTELALKDWALIIAVVVPTAIFTRQPILTLGAGLVLYLTRAFFGKDPMEARLKTMEDNIVWMQTLTYLLQTSKSAFESLEISAKALPEETGRQLKESLLRANTSIDGYVIRLRDALTMFAIRRADPQVDVVVAMVNANITSSGTTQDYKVMQQIQEQLKSELIEQNAAVSARREIFTIAKIMFPMVVIMESALSVMMGNFIEPYYRTAKGDVVLIFIELMTVGLLVLFRKISAPLPEIRLIVPETFMESLNKNMVKVSAISGEGVSR